MSMLAYTTVEYASSVIYLVYPTVWYASSETDLMYTAFGNIEFSALDAG